MSILKLIASMSNNKIDSLSNVRIYAQLLASILKSSYFGLLVFFSTLFFTKKNHLRVNSVTLSGVILLIIIFYTVPLIVSQSESGVSYFRTLLLWLLPVIYYSVGSKDLNESMYEKLLFIMVVYSIMEVIMINFTSFSLFDADRLRTQVFGIIRGEGVAHNSSISSALLVSIFLKIYLNRGLSKKLFFTTFFGVVFLGSGAGMLLFIFSVLFFIVNKKILFLTSLLIALLSIIFFNQHDSLEVLSNIHPKISKQYVLFLIDYKYEQISYILNTDIWHILFGFSILDNKVITSGDFGYLTMLAAIGLIPSLIVLFFIGMVFIRASRLGNFAPFLILMIENIHYPIFVDPISAYILVQYAMHEDK